MKSTAIMHNFLPGVGGSHGGCLGGAWVAGGDWDDSGVLVVRVLVLVGCVGIW